MKINYTEQRTKYKGMTTEEIVESMDLPELRVNARRGGVAAIAELQRRETAELVRRGIIPDNDIDIGI